MDSTGSGQNPVADFRSKRVCLRVFSDFEVSKFIPVNRSDSRLEVFMTVGINYRIAHVLYLLKQQESYISDELPPASSGFILVVCLLDSRVVGLP
jgi:hypothetical protein